MYTDRNRYIVLGGVGMVLLVGLVAIGIKSAFGAFDSGYELTGSFSAAGQGLIDGSDVKMRGVNVGEVTDIELVDNRAEITLRMNEGVRVPAGATATIRAKTLFGEKFVDIAFDDGSDGPYLSDGDEIVDAIGGFELEQVLSDAYPVLEHIDPAELATVLDEFAIAGDGLGDEINRSIVNSATLTELMESNDAEFRQFVGDLALLSEQMQASAPELVTLAQNLNDSLPTLNARSDSLNAALVQLARVSGDVADLLENNKDFTDNVLTDGSTALQVIYDARNRLQPTVDGAIKYVQLLSESIRVRASDGSMMAAVKNILSIEELITHEGSSGAPAPSAAASSAPSAPRSTPPTTSEPSGPTGLIDATTEAILGLFEDLVS